MEEWQKRQAHFEAYNKAFKDSGCKYFPNSKVPSRYNGPEFWKILRELGHSSTVYEECRCSKEKEKQRGPD